MQKTSINSSIVSSPVGISHLTLNASSSILLIVEGRITIAISAQAKACFVITSVPSGISYLPLKRFPTFVGGNPNSFFLSFEKSTPSTEMQLVLLPRVRKDDRLDA